MFALPIHKQLTYCSEILYATANDIPFMATSGKHGDMSTLQELRAGIQIDLRALDKVEVSADGDHALIGGGIRQKALISALASKRKRTGEQSLVQE